MGDRYAESRGPLDRGEGTERETGDDGRRFIAVEPVEQSGEDGQGGVASW